MDVVGIVVVEDEKLSVASAAGDDETAGLVGEDFSGSVDAGGVAVMSAFTSGMRSGKKDLVEYVVGSRWRVARLRGLLVLTGLVEVAFLHGNGGGRILG